MPVAAAKLDFDCTLVVDHDAEPADRDQAFLIFARKIVARRRLKQLDTSADAPAVEQ